MLNAIESKVTNILQFSVIFSRENSFFNSLSELVIILQISLVMTRSLASFLGKLKEGDMGGPEHRSTAKKNNEHRITARKIEETPSPSHTVRFEITTTPQIASTIYCLNQFNQNQRAL